MAPPYHLTEATSMSMILVYGHVTCHAVVIAITRAHGACIARALDQLSARLFVYA